jgi:hypothetical protein
MEQPMATMRGKRVLTSLYLDPAAADELRQLSAVTRVPQAIYLREAVGLLLAHYRQTVGLIAGAREAVRVPLPPTLERIIKGASRKVSRAAKHK